MKIPISSKLVKIENLEKITNINVSFEYITSNLEIFGGHFVNLTLFWPKNIRKVLNGLDQKGDVLEQNLELIAKSTKNINLEISDSG
jgi:hypothetical protein